MKKINFIFMFLLVLFVASCAAAPVTAPSPNFVPPPANVELPPLQQTLNSTGFIPVPKSAAVNPQQVPQQENTVSSRCFLQDYKYIRVICSFTGFGSDFAFVFEKWVGFKIIFWILAIIILYWLWGKLFNRP